LAESPKKVDAEVRVVPKLLAGRKKTRMVLSFRENWRGKAPTSASWLHSSPCHAKGEYQDPEIHGDDVSTGRT
jgi:hypothetical protein